MASDDLRARIAEIRAREEAATPGPWRVENNQQDLNRWVSSDDQTLDINFGYLGNRTQNDARFVAHSREDVPWLLAEVGRLTTALEVLTAQSATALVKRDRAKQRARVAEAELEALRGGLREIGGDPTQVQNLYAQLSSRTQQWKELQAESVVSDAAWGSVWLHGKWSWLTKCMTTEEREHAADCVARWSARLDVIEGEPDRGEPEGLRWWREPQAAPAAGLRGLLEHVGIDVAGRVITVDGVPIDDVSASSPTSVLSDRCPRCLCSDCGGRLDEHTETSCTCPSCEHSPSLACRLGDFLPDMRIGFIAEQLGPLLSVWLGEKQQRRCAVVAHAAHHALYDYDQQRGADRD